jgi:hypothetical protein
VALASGATVDEIVGVLIAVAPTVGLARVVSAAPEVAFAIGYDIDAALEEANGKDTTLQGVDGFNDIGLTSERELERKG